MGDRRAAWRVETVNVTGAGRLRERLAETGADIVLVQEHRADGARLLDLGALLAKDGWTVALSAAASSGRSDAGTSGGTGICLRRGLAMTQLRGMADDVEWPDEHRLTLRLVNAGPRGGLIVGSVYLTCGVGLSGPNLEYLSRLGQVLRALGWPFLLGGDFNMARGLLHDSGWLHAVGAVAIGPPEHEVTCTSSAAGSAIDYFVMSACLAPMVMGSWVVATPTVVRTHRPAMLDLSAQDRGRLVRKLRRPKRLDALPLLGPVPRPPCYREVQERIDHLKAGDFDQAGLDDVMQRWACVAEAEILGHYDCAGLAAFAGRICEPRYAWELATPVVRASPRADGQAALWHFIGDRLRQLYALQAGWRPERLATVRGLRNRLRRLRWPFRASKPPALWHWWCEWRRRLPDMTASQLQVLSQAFEREARARERQASSARARLWREWASHTAMENGARLAHRWSKPPPPWASTAS